VASCGDAWRESLDLTVHRGRVVIGVLVGGRVDEGRRATRSVETNGR